MPGTGEIGAAACLENRGSTPICGGSAVTGGDPFTLSAQLFPALKTQERFHTMVSFC